MVRIFAKKAIGFRNHETNQVIPVRALDFAELPDWVTQDPMFDWAKADGTIDVIEGAGPKITKTPVEGASTPADEENDGEPTPDASEDLNSLSKDELKAKAKEMGLPYSGKSKEELIEAIQKGE